MKAATIIFFFLILSIPCIYAQSWNSVGHAGFSAGPAQWTYITLDKYGAPYVAFQDSADGFKATVMRYVDESWTTVGNRGFSDSSISNISIAFDTGGYPYVAYVDFAAGFGATVKKFDGSNWVTVGRAGFSDTTVSSPSIAIGKSGIPYVAYARGYNQRATVMSYADTGWTVVGYPDFSVGPVQWDFSIDIDSSGMPYVIYRDEANGGRISVMNYVGGFWQFVGGAGFSPIMFEVAMALDKSGTPYVVYSDFYSGKATVMKYISTNWEVVGDTGFSAGGIEWPGIVIDGNGNPYVVYMDTGTRATVMKYDGSTWTNVGNPNFSAGMATTTTITMDNNGTPYVTYEDGGNGDKVTVMRYGFPAGLKNISDTSTSISVFPDPSHGAFTLNISSPQQEMATIVITNVLGEKIQELEILTNTEVAIQLNAPVGLYFINTKTVNCNQNTKIIINK